MGSDPPVIVSDPDKQNAIVLSVKSYKKNLLPTNLLADIRSSKRNATSSVPSGNNGAGHHLVQNNKKKNVNVISIRPAQDQENVHDNTSDGTATMEFHSNGVRGGNKHGDDVDHPEKYLSKKFINFSIHSMMDEDEEKADNGFFEGSGSPGSQDGEGGRLKSAFASMDKRKSVQFENDSFYNFHINENNLSYLVNKSDKSIFDTNEDSFAGYKDLATAYNPISGSSTIRSNKGTIRGVKNRVRNGIATFLQMQHANIKVIY